MKKISIVMVSLVASAGIAAGQGAGSGAPATKPAPPTVKAPDAKPPTPAPQMEMPKPPAELAELGKTVSGTWKCKGTTADPANPTATIAMSGTVKTKVDLDKWWIVDQMDLKAGKMPFKMMAYTTYDAKASKWRRIAVDNGGGQMVGTSDGMKDNKVTFNMDAMGPMGGGMMRDYTDMSDKKAGAHYWGEMSMDKGKTWMKVYDMTCKK